MNLLKLLGFIFYMILFCGTIQAQAEEITVQCEVFGLSTEDLKYKTIIEAEFGVNKETITKLEENPVFINSIKRDIESFKKMYISEGASEEEIQEILVGFYTPAFIDSNVFGAENGTQLQISIGTRFQMSQDGIDVVKQEEGLFVVFQYVTLNGVTIVSSIKNGFDRISFNKDSTSFLRFDSDGNHNQIPPYFQNPIVTPEGEFYFIYSECWEVD